MGKSRMYTGALPAWPTVPVVGPGARASVGVAGDPDNRSGFVAPSSRLPRHMAVVSNNKEPLPEPEVRELHGAERFQALVDHFDFDDAPTMPMDLEL